MRTSPRFYADLQRDLEAASGQLGARAGSRRRPVPLRPIAAVAGVAAGAVVAVVLLSAGSGPSEAAGWTAAPRAVPSQASVAAQSRCLAGLAEAGVPLRDARPGATTISASTALAEGWRPVALDSRGPFTLALFVRGGKLAACLQGGAGGDAITMGTANPAPVPAGRIVVDDTYGSGAVGGPSSTAVEGRVASDVSAVSLTLSDGTAVEATVADGWFVAWWPSSARARSARVTSSDLGTKITPIG